MAQSQGGQAMNKQQTIEAIKVMQAFVDGKEIECSISGTWIDQKNPCWDWAYAYPKYRVKPTKKLRPWTADEVPLGAWMRHKLNPQDRALIGWVSVQADRDMWLNEREHSLDGGKTWLSCGVKEAKP
jgi:hypothetical protein